MGHIIDEFGEEVSPNGLHWFFYERHMRYGVDRMQLINIM